MEKDYKFIDKGYGLGINWEDKKAILNLIKCDFIIEDFKKYIKENFKEEDLSSDKVLLAAFYYDKQDALFVIEEAINKEVKKRFKKEKRGVAMNIVDPDCFSFYFKHIPYGIEPKMTKKEVNDFIKELASIVYNIDIDLPFEKFQSNILKRKGVFGSIKIICLL